jgi:hypothetical protein
MMASTCRSSASVNFSPRPDGRPLRVDAAPQLAFDPFARFPRVAADQKSQRPLCSGVLTGAHRADERGSEPCDGLVIEGIFAGGAPDAVRAEKSMHE